MTATATMTAMPELPWPGQKVRWRNRERARAWGWETVFGPDPFAVVRTVDHSRHRLATGLVLRTAVGEQEISEVWLALADEPESDSSSRPALLADLPMRQVGTPS
jgi:hypothetical protein